MRDESQAPRNSRELAVRNQFFTPRYVVQFLVDNTLGRTWIEMFGETKLTSMCEYLVELEDERPTVSSERSTRLPHPRPRMRLGTLSSLLVRPSRADVPRGVGAFAHGGGSIRRITA